MPTSIWAVRSVATFLSLMAAGILIVLIYVWSGESIVALVLAIITLFAVLALLQWQPWAIDDAGSTRSRSVRGKSVRDRSVQPESARERSAVSKPTPTAAPGATSTMPVWRCSFDITWDGRGVSGLALGSRAPQMWSWSQIDDIGYDWFSSTTDAALGDDEERLAFRLDFPDHSNPEEPARAWVRFGPQQQPEDVERQARNAWRDTKVKRSRLVELTPQERTLKLADHVAPDRLNLTDWPRSPELLYQEVRRELITGGELCRLSHDSSFNEVLDAFDAMLGTKQVDLITQAEADELLRVDGPERVAALHRTLDWVAEQRGLRMMFIDQSASHSGDDYLVGLIPAVAADDWDGQTVGNGSTRVLLDLPI